MTPETFTAICAAFGWPPAPIVEAPVGGVYAVVASIPAHADVPSQSVHVLGADEAEALASYRRQVVLRCAQSLPGVRARIADAHAAVARDEASIALVAEALAP